MLFEITINEKIFKVSVADTETLRYKGLSGVPKLGKHKGMLFMFPDPTEVNMVMRDMLIDLDFIFLDEKWNIVQLGSLNKDSETDIQSTSQVQMVLEVNKGVINEYNIKPGDKLKPGKGLNIQLKGVQKFKDGGKFEMVGDKVYNVTTDDIKIDPSKLQILNNDGEVVANIESGSRIFSRGDTEDIIKKVKKGDKVDLANFMIATLNKQDNQEQDFVSK